jgi:hypothetical protein
MGGVYNIEKGDDETILLQARGTCLILAATIEMAVAQVEDAVPFAVEHGLPILAEGWHVFS